MNLEEQREDFLGQLIGPGDYVLSSDPGGGMTPELFQIVKFTPKKVRLKGIGWRENAMRTASDLVKIDPQLITMYKLKKKPR